MAGRTLALGLCAGLLAPVPAQAVIVRAGKDGKADAEKAHAAGKKHTAAVGLVFISAGTGTKGYGSGVYIGPNKAGTKGLVLTAAHSLQNDPSLKSPYSFKDIVISFGPAMRSKPLMLRAERAILHPEFTYYLDESSKDGDDKAIPVPWVRNDLAVLEFDFPGYQKMLEESGITPASLHDGEGCRTAPRLDAEMAGFGFFGSNRSELKDLSDELRINAAGTYVTYGEWRGSKEFLSWVYLGDAALENMMKESAGGGSSLQTTYQFDGDAEEVQGWAAEDKSVKTSRPHPDQGVLFQADSGGPLFLATSEGPKVIGLMAKINFHVLCSRQGEPMGFTVMGFTPVIDHLPWIKDLAAGETGKSPILQPKEGVWGVAEKAAAPVAGEERKEAGAATPAVETKVATSAS
jgi:hypothetical protein